MAAGGGDRGKAVGTAHSSIIQVGATIGKRHPFIAAYLKIGEMIIAKDIGKGINGTGSEYPINKLSKIGKAGKTINIGKSKTVGG
jgi:hypothetical protein